MDKLRHLERVAHSDAHRGIRETDSAQDVTWYCSRHFLFWIACAEKLGWEEGGNLSFSSGRGLVADKKTLICLSSQPHSCRYIALP